MMNNSSAAFLGFTETFQKELIACYVFKYLIGFIGGITNIFLIIVCCLQKNTLSSGIKWLVVQYSFAYFSISFIMYPVRDTMIMGMQFHFLVPLSEYCPHFATANTLCWSLANWTEVCLALNRLVAICFPHYYHIMKLKKTIFGSMIFAWTATFVLILPAIYAWPGQIVSKTALAQCMNLQSGQASDFVTTWETFIPYCLTGVIAASILIKAAMMNRKQKVSDCNKDERRQMKTHRQRMKLAFMLVASFAWNCLCSLPFLVISMGMSFLFRKYPSLPLWARLLRSVQVALSPLVFFLFNEDYRQTGKRLIGKMFRSQTQHVEEDTQRVNKGTKVNFNESRHESTAQSKPPELDLIVISPKTDSD